MSLKRQPVHSFKRFCFLVGLFLVVLLPSPSVAVGYKVQVDAPKEWSKGITRVAVVVTVCHESLNCEDLRKQITGRLMAQTKKLPFSVVPDQSIADIAGWDWDSKDPDTLRSAVFAKVNVDAILEVQVPFAHGGQFGARGAEARTRVRVVIADGATKMSGDCSAQAFNTVSSPENIGRHCALRIVGEALHKNLD